MSVELKCFVKLLLLEYILNALFLENEGVPEGVLLLATPLKWNGTPFVLISLVVGNLGCLVLDWFDRCCSRPIAVGCASCFVGPIVGILFENTLSLAFAIVFFVFENILPTCDVCRLLLTSVGRSLGSFVSDDFISLSSEPISSGSSSPSSKLLEISERNKLFISKSKFIRKW